jgi:signal transduction histidine kinase
MSTITSAQVLVVDDDPDACTSLRRILRMDGYQVDIAHSIKEMFAPREWPDYMAIILDRKLSDGTTDELLPEIKQRAPAAAIVIITGSADLESSITALRHGAEDYILKPINPAAFRATLARINRLRIAEMRALQAERLAAIGQVATSLAHESRNFLQRISVSLEFLEEITQDNPEARAEIARIQAAEEGLERLLEELRQFAAPMKLDKDDCAVQSVWRQAWSHVAKTQNVSHARFDDATSEANLRCHIDAFRFGQVFRNLFENSLAACQGTPTIQVHCQNGNGTLKIAIKDNGPGLSAEQRRSVFQPFYTTKAKGTGLGLAIVKRIVEAHGGDIVVADDTFGAEFLITIPLDD